MTRTLVAPALTLCATSALAQDHNRQDLVRGLCQKDGCDEFTILAADRVKTTEEGTLFKTRLKTFHASHAGRQERGEENGYVYCSPTRPAIMADQNGQTMAFFLAPFATQESRESMRQNANFHALYFTICHGREAGKAAVHNESMQNRGVIRLLLAMPGHHSRAGSPDNVAGRRPRVCRSARPCARPGRAARSLCSSASAVPCSCAWPRSR